MATTPNGIATEKETKILLLLSVNPEYYSENKLITKTRVLNDFGGFIDETRHSYSSDYLCVRYSDIYGSQSLTWSYHDDLVIPGSITSYTAPDVDYRLDADFVWWDNTTAKYNALDPGYFTYFYEYGGTPYLISLGPGWYADLNFDLDKAIYASLLTISNCGILTPVTQTSQLVQDFSYNDDDACLYEFDRFPDNFRALTHSYNGISVLGSGSVMSVINGSVDVKAVMRAGLQFDVIYLISSDGYAKLDDGDPIQIHTLIISGTNANDVEYHIDTNTIYIGTDAYIKANNKTSDLFKVVTFIITDEDLNQYLTLRFIKCVTFGDDKYFGYYLCGLILNTKEIEKINFEYSRGKGSSSLSPVTGFWKALQYTTQLTTDQYCGIDTTGMYSISFFTGAPDSPTDIFFDQLIWKLPYLSTSCCIVDPMIDNLGNYLSLAINTRLNNNSVEDIGLCYTRAPEAFLFNTGTGTEATSFPFETILKHQLTYADLATLYDYYEWTFPQECYICVYCSDDQTLKKVMCDTLEIEDISDFYDRIATLTSNVDNLQLFAIPESMFFLEEDNSRPNSYIEVNEFPRAINVRIPYFGKLIYNLMDFCKDSKCYEFYLYYKTHFYHYNIIEKE